MNYNNPSPQLQALEEALLNGLPLKIAIEQYYQVNKGRKIALRLLLKSVKTFLDLRPGQDLPKAKEILSSHCPKQSPCFEGLVDYYWAKWVVIRCREIKEVEHYLNYPELYRTHSGNKST